MGYRLHRSYIDSPHTSSQIFGNDRSAFLAWQETPNRVSQLLPNETIAAATVDLKSFFYSVNLPPSEIMDRFMKENKNNQRLSIAGRVLTNLLDALHLQYSSKMKHLNPRKESSPGEVPLPIGLPSSKVLANLTMGIAIQELKNRAEIIEVAVYADDILILTKSLPNLLEGAAKFLQRIGVIQKNTENDFGLQTSPQGASLARFDVGLSKTSISYGRWSVLDEPNADFRFEFSDRIRDSSPDADWGGRLRTILTSPFKRDRVPRDLEQELHTLTEEVRVGLDAPETKSSLETLLTELDRGSLLALRSTWTELVACALHTRSHALLSAISERLVESIGGIVGLSERDTQFIEEVKRGLRASWEQALIEALAVTDIESLIGDYQFNPLLSPFHESAESIVSRARLSRAANFVLPSLVSMPLSEFSSYEGALFGEEALRNFSDWLDEAATDRISLPINRVDLSRSMRFITLQETCLAVHLWIGGTGRNWLNSVFRALASQPLVNKGMIADLRRRCNRIMGSFDTASDSPAMLSAYKIRFSIPSLQVCGNQLSWIIDGNSSALSSSARDARKAVRAVVQQSIDRRANFTVLPEWAVLQSQLSWVFSKAAKGQMVLVAGEAPMIQRNEYKNRLWTGIPVVDRAGHRACLVPPPRDKAYLSPVERAAVQKARVIYNPSNTNVRPYYWRGVKFSSLICYEFADISVRNSFRRDTDILTVSSWNTDWRYFDSIQSSTTRDNYCITVCVNTGQFPGTQIMRPTASARAVASSIHGSGDPTVVTRVIDLLPVVVARASGRRPSLDSGFIEATDDVKLEDYSALPPDLS
nr:MULTISPECIES: reverse transcriptase domain-containing protein [unclassified Rhodococcus (in: high G+C Gram-positive bacteria)]